VTLFFWESKNVLREKQISSWEMFQHGQNWLLCLQVCQKL
jgi:hypothetical protein